jgi:hypothetical protein
MKKILVFISMLAMCSFAQQNGNISLIFNGEQIDLPIKQVFLNKDEVIVLSFEAEKQDSTVQQFVSLSIGLKKLSPETGAETFEGTKIIIKTRDNKTDSGNELSMQFDDKEQNNNKQTEAAHFAIYKKGERVSWEINSVSFKLDITKVEYQKSMLHIIGVFEGTFNSNSAPEGQLAQIEEGKFEVIL